MVYSKAKTIHAIEVMGEMFPEAKAELEHRNAFELLIAVMLSAQATDISVNKATPALFAAYPTPEAFVAADLYDIEDKIKTIGLYRNKAKHIKGCCERLVNEYQSQVPQTREDLMTLPGVGRKTANVVLGDAFGIPAIAVDTHVERVTKRLGICRIKDTVLQVEETLMEKLPKKMWVDGHHRLIFFGRYHCTARKPKCDQCPLLAECREGRLMVK
ncbi:endonuclease III [Isobaculum melis]|uniref:Endonuclease III n=1 Tax=Isobaculum melis TaxID=142588 RepID=A0A1H9RWJ3_9LACT|nr:endonuclease III [Isobaculum melis]SER76968.1 DNA-(apurinic or apyrimidinic site) lyase /endonuclease III [Isobaculum melis]